MHDTFVKGEDAVLAVLRETTLADIVEDRRRASRGTGMTVVVATFLALLTLTAVAGIVVVVVLAIVGRLDRCGTRWTGALWLAFLVALTATAGSLYFSQVAGWSPARCAGTSGLPCTRWSLILGIAAWRGDWGVRRYVAPLAAIGALIAAYHVVLQRVPSLPSTGCSVTAPCSAIDLERFGFVTIPFMALVAFAAILTVLFATRPGDR